MPRTKQPETYIATSSGVLKINGKIERYTAGQTIVHRSHPLYQAIPERFQPLTALPVVEQATAAPGERRS